MVLVSGQVADVFVTGILPAESSLATRILTTHVVTMEFRESCADRSKPGPLVRCPLESRHAYVETTSSPPACVQLLGGAGGPALTVRAKSRHAGLTERYFYESFADREHCVRAVYDDVCTRAMATSRPRKPRARPSNSSS